MRPGAQMLPKSFIASHQKERIMRALAQACSEVSFHHLTVAMIVAEAGIARNTFYENFRSKDDCFLAAFMWCVSMAEEHCLDAENTDDAIEGIVAVVEEESKLARLVLIEGPLGALEAYDDMSRRFAEFTELPEPMAEMVVGGVMRILNQHLREGTDDLLPNLQEFVRRSFSTASLVA